MIRPSCNMTHNMDPGFRPMNRYIVRNIGTHAAYAILPMSNSVHPAYGPISPGLKDVHRVDRYPQPVKSVSGPPMHPKITQNDHPGTPFRPVLGPKVSRNDYWIGDIECRRHVWGVVECVLVSSECDRRAQKGVKKGSKRGQKGSQKGSPDGHFG